MTIPRIVLFVLSVAFAGLASAEVIVPLEPGEAAPPLELDAILHPAGDAGSGADSAPMVVEFWATWCHPCVEAIPHWNRLVDAFAGEKIVFLSITDEEERRVSEFLEGRPIRGWVGIDLDRSTFHGFGVTSIPRAVLVTRDGRIAATTRPDLIDERAVRDLLAGRFPRLPPNPAWGITVVEAGEYRPDGGWPPTELTIGPAQLEQPSWSVRPEILLADGVDAGTALAIAWDLHPEQVLVPSAVRDRRLQLVASEAGASEDALRRRLREPLLAELGVAVREERRTLRVGVLRDAPGDGGRLRPAGSERPFVLYRPSYESADDRPFAELVAGLREVLDLPVVDETGLGGRWDWRISWQEGVEAVRELVREQLGMELAIEEREVPVLVVGPRS